MTVFLRRIGIAALAVPLTLTVGALPGCEDDPGDDFRDAAEEAREGLEKSTKQAGEKIEDAGDEIRDKTR